MEPGTMGPGAGDPTAIRAPASASATKAARRPVTTLDRQIGRADAFHAGLRHLIPRLGERAIGVDAAAGVLHHQRPRPTLRASRADQQTQKSVARPTRNTWRNPRSRT